jgi:hypothetical protein
LGFYAALGTYCRVHLTLAALALVASAKVAALFTSGAAGRATARLVLESFFSIEFLFTRGEFEINAAISAFQYFVFKHGKSSSIILRAADSGQRGFPTLSGRQNVKRRTGTVA